MALSNLEQALIERLQSSEHIYNGLINAAYIVHEITRIHAPDTETPEDYIRRAVQETFDNQYQAGITYAANIVYGASFVNFSSDSESPAAYIQRVVMELRNLTKDPINGLDLAVEVYKQHSGFQFNAQSGRPTDYLIEMATRHKQLFEAPANSEHPLTEAVRLISSVSGLKYNPMDSQKTYLTNFAKRYKQLSEAPHLIDIQAGVEQAAMLISARAPLPKLPTETNEAYLVRVADQLKHALTTAERVPEPKQPQAVDIRPGMEHAAILVSNRAGMPIFPSESNDAYLVRVAEQLRDALTTAEQARKSEVEFGLQLAAEILTKDTKTWMPGEPAREYIKRVASWYQQPLTSVSTVTTLAVISEIPIIIGESNDSYIKRVAEIAKRAPKPNSKFSELLDTIAIRARLRAMREDESDIDFVKRCLDEIDHQGYTAAALALFELTGIVPTFNPEEFNENADAYLKQIAELINKNKKPE